MREPASIAEATPRLHVEVSPEMTLLLGDGPLVDAPVPPEPIAIGFDIEAEPTLFFDLACTHATLAADTRLTLVIQRSAYERIGGSPPADSARGFHLPAKLRAIAHAIRDSALNGETLRVYRLGKSIELLCETIRAMNEDGLVPLASDGFVSFDDARRIVAARRLIDERWGEKLTLDKIARACGLNRAKLTRGFRDMFHCTVAEAIAEQRLGRASEMLRTTDLPISSIGYENGYLNNASFSRAFGRRFGVSPTDFRACPAAA